MKGKYFSPSKLILSKSNFETTSYNLSIKICQLFGIKKRGELLKQSSLELKKYTILLNRNKVSMFINNKFVAEKSEQNIFTDNSEKVANFIIK